MHFLKCHLPRTCQKHDIQLIVVYSYTWRKRPESTFLSTSYFHDRLPLKAMCHVQAFQPFEMLMSKTQPLKLPHYQCNRQPLFCILLPSPVNSTLHLHSHCCNKNQLIQFTDTSIPFSIVKKSFPAWLGDTSLITKLHTHLSKVSITSLPCKSESRKALEICGKTIRNALHNIKRDKKLSENKRTWLH